MRLITTVFATMLAVAVFAPTKSAQAASVTWCLGLDNNKNLLAATDCPLVYAVETNYNEATNTFGDGVDGLAVSVETQSDVLLEQFGIQWDTSPFNTALIQGLTIAGAEGGIGDASVEFMGDELTWVIHSPQPDAQMDGFGNFELVFDLDGQGSNHGIPSTAPGDQPVDAAIWFFIVGGNIEDFGVSFSPNCDDVTGCIQAAKISSEQLGYAGGYVSNVPLPGAVWLFLSALAGLFGVGYVRRGRTA